MTITISNLTISNNAPSRSIIGVLTAQDASGTIIPCSYTLTKGSIGYFAIVGEQLVTAWSIPVMPGYYSVRIRAIGLSGGFSGSARFAVNIVMAAPPPPPPPPPPIPVSVSLTPAAASLTDNSPIGTQVCSVAVNMSDGSPFAGQISINPGNMIGMSGLNSVLTRGLVSTDDGSHSFGITATQNSVSAQATLTVNVIAVAPPPPPPPPPGVVLTVNGANGSTTAPPGSSLTISVSNGPANQLDWVAIAPAGSNGRTYGAWCYLSGTQTPPPTGLAQATVTLPAPTIVGAYEVRFLPNNLYVVTASVALSVAAGPVITVTPSTPIVPDTTAKGAVVAAYTVAMSDGSPFTGTIGFGAPNFDAGGIFALTGTNTSGQIIVNPSGPGVGPSMTTVTDHITLAAAP